MTHLCSEVSCEAQQPAADVLFSDIFSNLKGSNLELEVVIEEVTDGDGQGEGSQGQAGGEPQTRVIRLGRGRFNPNSRRYNHTEVSYAC